MLFPRDLVVLVKAHHAPQPWAIQDLASGLGLQPVEVQRSLVRAAESGLFWSEQRLLVPAALVGFAAGGLREAFPPHIDRDRGPVDGWLAVDTGVIGPRRFVWPRREGDTRGEALRPLHPCVYRAIEGDPQTWRTLQCLEAFRVGGPRDRNKASEQLTESLLNGQPDWVRQAL